MGRDKLLTSKELAFELRKHISYIGAMRKQGFKMPGMVASLRSAMLWLSKNPSPRSRVNGQERARKGKKGQAVIALH